MKIVDFGRFALGTCVAAAMLAGCGGSQPPIGASGAMPQTSGIATHADGGKSWMRPGTSGDLIYVAAAGKSYVLTYPQGKLVGTIDYSVRSEDFIPRCGHERDIDCRA